jgi:hypothetical protein
MRLGNQDTTWFDRITAAEEFRLTEPVRAITIRGLRIVWRVLLLATVVYVWVAERHHPTAKQISRACYIAICVVSICVICTMFLVRKLSAKRLATSSHPADPKTLRRAYADQLLLMGCSLAVVLYGLVVRFTGATLGQALPFYVVGSALLLYFKPKEIGAGSK